MGLETSVQLNFRTLRKITLQPRWPSADGRPFISQGSQYTYGCRHMPPHSPHWEQQHAMKRHHADSGTERVMVTLRGKGNRYYTTLSHHQKGEMQTYVHRSLRDNLQRPLCHRQKIHTYTILKTQMCEFMQL